MENPTPTQHPENQYALVSSLYGPGTVACWYLTTLSVVVSWTMHPRKRNSGSIDADMIAVLTLPIVAAGHLISQMEMFGPTQKNIPGHRPKSDETTTQRLAAIEASFSVTETFMGISVVLFLIVSWTRCLRRAAFVSLTRILCFTVQCYMHFASYNHGCIRYPGGASEDRSISASGDPYSRNPSTTSSAVRGNNGPEVTASPYWSLESSQYNAVAGLKPAVLRPALTLVACSDTMDGDLAFSRSFVADSSALVLSNIAILGICAAIGFLSLSIRRTLIRPSHPERARSTLLFWVVAAWTILFSLPSFGITTVPLISDAITIYGTVSNDSSAGAPLRTVLRQLTTHFFPHSSSSVSDLDQAVAIVAGATVLAFSIYSAVKEHSKTLRGVASRPEQDSVELADHRHQDDPTT